MESILSENYRSHSGIRGSRKTDYRNLSPTHTFAGDSALFCCEPLAFIAPLRDAGVCGREDLWYHTAFPALDMLPPSREKASRPSESLKSSTIMPLNIICRAGSISYTKKQRRRESLPGVVFLRSANSVRGLFVLFYHMKKEHRDCDALFSELPQQIRTFVLAKYESHNGKNNCWTQY